MCFHVSKIKTPKELENRFGVTLAKEEIRETFEGPDFHLNGFAHPQLLIIPQEEPSVLINATWGIVPANTQTQRLSEYYKNALKFGGGLNAQSEKLFDHFIYKYSAKTRRCLIPVDGFFEPHEFNNRKYPYYIRRTDEQSFALAGLYTVLKDQLTFTILTRSASPYFEAIHNVKKRQPVLLSKDLEPSWLKDTLKENEIEEMLQNQYPIGELENFPVNRDLFNPRINSNQREFTQPFNYPELARLF